MEISKCFLLVISLSFALILGLGTSFDFHETELESEEGLWNLYERWRSYHTVSRSLDEKEKRFNVFKHNVKYVHDFNQKDKPYKLKLNKFADMTNHEFRSSYAGSKIEHHRLFRGRANGNGTSSFMYEKVMQPIVSIDGHEDVPENDEDALLKAAANQPISVAIEAAGYDFQFYSEGVFTGDCGTELDHGVAIVGYGTTQDGTKYWIVKNSWGADWGEKGFIRMQRGVSRREGLCGIAMQASYPIKTSSSNPQGSPSSPSSPKDEL